MDKANSGPNECSKRYSRVEETVNETGLHTVCKKRVTFCGRLQSIVRDSPDLHCAAAARLFLGGGAGVRPMELRRRPRLLPAEIGGRRAELPRHGASQRHRGQRCGRPQPFRLRARLLHQAAHREQLGDHWRSDRAPEHPKHRERCSRDCGGPRQRPLVEPLRTRSSRTELSAKNRLPRKS